MNTDKSLAPRGPQIPLPASARLVTITLALAFLCNLLPWPDGIAWMVPDFALVVLLYWNIVAPRRAGLGLAFLLGLLADASHGAWMGQQAFSYVLSAYVALRLQRRLENFPLFGRAMHLAPILFFQSVLVLLSGAWLGAQDIDWRYLTAGATAALLWLPIAIGLDRLNGRPATLLAETAREGK